jgi:hypothetical protein
MLSPTSSFASAAVVVLALLPLLTVSVQAQTAVVGRVLDSDGVPVSLANVQLRAHPDSAVAMAAISDSRGNFVIEAARPGAYWIQVSRIGYRTTSSEVLTLAEGGTYQLAPLVLQTEAVALEEVAVAARKPLYQQQADRLIINLESSPSLSGASALQVLERSPGVVVDRMSNAVSLIGKSGARVMVNGRLSYVPAEALLQYLSGMSADNLERIELITTPPASLDAEGNAGYINLVMKRSPGDGLNGSFTLSGGYGEGEVGNASTSLNYQQNRISLFGTYSFLWEAQRQSFSTFRRMVGSDAVTEMPAASWRDPVQRNHDVRIGIDYRVSASTTVGALVGAFDNHWSMQALNRLTVLSDDTQIARVDSDNDEVNHWRHAMGNLNLEHQLGSASTLRLDLDVLRYGNDNPTAYLNTWTDVASGGTTNEWMKSGKNTPLRILVARADYTNTRGSWQLGAGVKGAFSRFTNETQFEATTEPAWASEAGIGSTSRLREDVVAVYGSADFKPRPSTTLKTGLRYEWTASNLGSDAQEDIVDRRFGSLFPSLALSLQLSEDDQLDASYTRRITRPSFRDMAPFFYFLDPQSYFSGNAGLQPAITNTLKLDVTHRSVLVSLQYAWEDSTIAPFQNRYLPEHRIHVLFPTNFRGTRTASALLAAPLRLSDWWGTQNNVMLMRQEVEGMSNGAPVSLAMASYRLNTTQSLDLPGDYGIEASGYYQSESLFGATRFGSLWQVDLAVQKTLGSRGKLTLTVSDLFESAEWRWTTGSPGDALHVDTLIDFSRRSVSLSYATRFGGDKPGGKRATASEDERGRVQQ